MKKIVQKVIAAGIVKHNGKVLIICREKNDNNFPGLWEIPSGKKEDMESVEDAAVREVKEETGLNVKIIKPAAVFNYINEKSDEIRDATQICFLVKIIGEPKVTLSSEHDDYAWVSETELDNYNVSRETKNAIVLALNSGTE